MFPLSDFVLSSTQEFSPVAWLLTTVHGELHKTVLSLSLIKASISSPVFSSPTPDLDSLIDYYFMQGY